MTCPIPYSTQSTKCVETNLAMLIFLPGSLRLNLINLSCGLNLSRGSNMVVHLKIAFNFSRFKPALNLTRFLGDLRRSLNLLNSNTGSITSEFLKSLTPRLLLENLLMFSAVSLLKKLTNFLLHERWGNVRIIQFST